MLSIDVENTTLMFEHSLLSLSKWESEYEKPFFRHEFDTSPPRTVEETVAYFHCMLVSPLKKEHLIDQMTQEDGIKLMNYINANRTATTVREIQGRPGNKDNVTSELIYFWMISFQIPFDCETWHLNRLMTLIRVCGVKNSKQPKRSEKAVAQDFRRINEERRKKLGTSG